MEMDKATPEKTDAEYLEHLIQKVVGNYEYDNDDRTNFRLLTWKYGYDYIDHVIRREVDIQEKGIESSPVKYFVRDESDEEIALTKRCPLRGTLSSGGKTAYNIYKAQQVAELRAIMAEFCTPINYFPVPGENHNQQWKSNISKAKLDKNGRKIALTAAERKNKWKEKNQKPKKTEDEKKLTRAKRNRKHYEQKLKDGEK